MSDFSVGDIDIELQKRDSRQTQQVVVDIAIVITSDLRCRVKGGEVVEAPSFGGGELSS